MVTYQNPNSVPKLTYSTDSLNKNICFIILILFLRKSIILRNLKITGQSGMCCLNDFWKGFNENSA